MTVALAMGAHFVAFTLVPLYGVALGVAPVTQGLLISLTFVAPLFIAIPLGSVIDRLGATRFMRAGTGLAAALPLLVVMWPSVVSLAILQLGLGVAQILLMLSGQATAAALGDGKQRLRSLGWYTMSVSVGQMLGPLAAGFGADALGLRLAFLIGAALSTGGFVGSVLMRSVAHGPREGFHALVIPVELGRMWQNSTFRLAVLVSSAVLMSVAVNQAFLPLLLGAASYSATTIGMLFSLQGLSAMLIRPFVGWVASLFRSNSGAILAVFGAVAAGVCVIGVQSSLLLVVLAMILLGAGGGVSQPLSMAMVLEQIQERQHGLALGFRITLNRLSQVAGPLAIGYVATLSGLRSGYLFTLLLMVMLVFASFLRFRRGV